MGIDRRVMVAWAATLLLLVLCLTPKSLMPRGEKGPRRMPNADKVVHFAMFAGFAMVWMRAGRSPLKERALWVIGWGVVFAVGTEVLQGIPVVGRDSDVRDGVADVFGVLFGVALMVGAGSKANLLGDEG